VRRRDQKRYVIPARSFAGPVPTTWVGSFEICKFQGLRHCRVWARASLRISVGAGGASRGESQGFYNCRIPEIPISQLATLAQLPPEQQAEGLLRAEQIAQEQGKKRNAKHIAQAVREIQPVEPQHNRRNTAVPSAIEVELDEWCAGIMSNVNYLGADRVGAVFQALLPQLSPEALSILSNQELTELVERVNRELSQRSNE